MQDKKKIYILLGIIIVASLVIEIVFAHPHYHMIWNTVPGADILMGFAGAWILIILAKKIMATIFQRDEDYYDGGERHDG